MTRIAYAFELKNDLAELDRLCQNCETVGASLGLSKKLIFEMNLALDELFTNIISYAFQDNREHIIKIDIAAENRELKLRIEDDGIPFDPAMAEAPDLACKIEKCKIGGLGIHLIKNLMDEIRYERVNDTNILYLTKKIHASLSGKKQNKNCAEK
jgi:anti-sigma regulatory factor (Ser/Thr protein kinase)